MAQLVFAMAELMVVLDATVLAVALVDKDTGLEGVMDQFADWPSNRRSTDLTL